MSEHSRYRRQYQVEKIGASGQKEISSSNVVIIGIGGLGCHLAFQLAGAGVGHVTLIDHDVIELSNLHRQILFSESDVGKPKADVAAEKIQSINSTIQVKPYCARLTADNIDKLCNSANLIIDAADNTLVSFLLSDYCCDNHIPLLSASVNSTYGYVAVFCGDKENPLPSFRAVFPKLTLQENDCNLNGVTGPSVGIIGSLQSQEAIKLLIDDPNQLNAQLLYFDCWNYQLHRIDFSQARNSMSSQIRLVSASEIQQQDLIVDVRNEQESKHSPLKFERIMNLPLARLSETADTLPNNTNIVCACVSGQRALMAAQQLLSLGNFENISVLIPE